MQVPRGSIKFAAERIFLDDDDPLLPLHFGASLWKSRLAGPHDSAPRPAWLRVDRLLGEWAIRWDQPGAGRQFSLGMEARRRAEAAQQFRPVERD